MATASGHHPEPRKRRRDSAEPPKKRHRKQQRNLCNLNIDELCIIFAYVYAMDLLNLARTCKSLRAILMHKSSQFLWIDALRQVEGLPPCPPDLSEPEYTNLVFHPRCHGCGKSAQIILWNMRRRYCLNCRVARLRWYESCNVGFQLKQVLPRDRCKVGHHGSGPWVDGDQMNSIVREYHSSSNKEEFLTEKRKHFEAISLHARQCEEWKKQKGQVHGNRFDLEDLRKERGASIINRLKQHGYAPEIAFVGNETIENDFKCFFKKYKPLTDSEWNQMLPEWIGIMNNLRKQRLETTVYIPRRRLLVSAYDSYVTCPSSNTPIFDLLPRADDLMSSNHFQDILKAPEEAQLDRELFTSAFLQIVGKWRRQLDDRVARMAEIPSHLSLDGVTSDRVVATNKLHLACALFHASHNGLFTHPEVFLTVPRNFSRMDKNGPMPIDLCGVRMLAEAPYIVHACGLDPHVATMHDMDQRNARLRCLYCKRSFALVVDWRSAMLHALYRHQFADVPLSERWQLVSDEHIDAIRAVEELPKHIWTVYDYRRCLLCQPRVGDALRHSQIVDHLQRCHGIEMSDPKRGVHYEHLGLQDHWISVLMVEEGGQVIFREP